MQAVVSSSHRCGSTLREQDPRVLGAPVSRDAPSVAAATGRLADPSDLPFDATHLDDEQALTQAIDTLIAAKPHLASRRLARDIGQGAGQPNAGLVNRGRMLRDRA
jgi:hypothetical protein